MTTSKAGRLKIEQFESCVLHAYKARPSEKYYTIGYGHYGADVTEGMTISQEQADDLFAADLKRFETAVNNLGMKLNQAQFDALVDFAYNCGEGALASVCKSKDLNTICNKIPEWCKDAAGHVLAGLKRRRAWEVSQIKQPSTHATVTADVLNIREEAGTDKIIIGTFKHGETVAIYETWCKTSLGWVSADYLNFD